MKRRDFIQRSAMAAAALAIPSSVFAIKKKSSVGLQLYTLRQTIEKDPKGHLEKIASFGYKKLEAYGYRDGKIFGLDYAEFAKIANDLGMKITSAHYGLEIVDSPNWEKALADAKSVGQKYVVLPWLQEKERGSIDNFKRICGVVNKAGEVAKKYGLSLQYHNHDFEFFTVDGQIPYDVMLMELDPKYVGMEMDIFWVYNAGKDPLDYFNKYPGRFQQWHVKDMDKSDKSRNANIGDGTVDWKKIFSFARKSGMKNFYIEQETYPGEPIDSVAAGIKYLNTIL